MPKKVFHALTPLSVKNAKPGRHADGQGLHLLVKDTGARSWVYRFMLDGKSRDVGLTRCPEAIALLRKSGENELTLAQARDVAAIYRLKVKAGIDPLEEREQAEAAEAAAARAAKVKGVTFKAVAQTYIETNADSWRNAKHRQQWRNTLEQYVYPVIGSTPVSEVSSAQVLEIIEPIWKTKPETASRVRGRIEVVLDAAKARGYRDGENPARWRGHIAQLLPKRSRLTRGHHAALPYDRVPVFMQALRMREAVAALALEFTILTATRSGEVLDAVWTEVDLGKSLWTIPAARMKAGKEHRVPLSPRAEELLRKAWSLNATGAASAPLFPASTGKPLSEMAMAMLIKRMHEGECKRGGEGFLDPIQGRRATVHGFRSSFRDWSDEQTAYPHEMKEMALAHTIGNKAEAAYRRGDLFEKRRRLMDDWAVFCSKAEANAHFTGAGSGEKEHRFA